MRAKWVAVLVLTALLAGCGEGAPRAATGAAASTRSAGMAALTSAPVGSRMAALAVARRLLARLVPPPGATAAEPAPVPSPLSVPSTGGSSPHTVVVHRFILVRERATAVHAFLLAHVPAAMSIFSTGLAPGATNTITVLAVVYQPRSLASGLTDAMLGTAALPQAHGETLIRADASVTWFPPRSAAERLTAASFRSVTVTAIEVIPRPHTMTRTFTSPAVIRRLVALADSLPATPSPDVAGMSCLAVATVYRLAFTPGADISAGQCGDSDAVTVNGKQQPRLRDSGVLTTAARQLLGLPT